MSTTKTMFKPGETDAALELPKEFRTRALEVSHSELRADESGDELLELDLAFASEEPVERFFGTEVLSVTAEAARLDRVAQGVCPVLSNHNSDEVIGRVLTVTIGSDRVARARVRFSRSAAARDVVQDVVDGIRQGISFGYRVHSMELEGTGDDGDRFRVSDWELHEITVASMPADPTVGLHRSADSETFEARVSRQIKRESKMIRALHVDSGQVVEIDEAQVDGQTYVRAADPQPAPEPAPIAAIEAREINPQPSQDVILENERARVSSLEEIGRSFGASEDLVRSAVRGGQTVDGFLGELRMERAKSGEPLTPPPTDLDLSAREREEYSILSAVRVNLDRRAGRKGENSLELEASDEIAQRLDRSPQGFFVPWDVLNRSAFDLEERAITTTGAGNGAALVGTELMAGGFIDLLRNRSVVGALGATVIPGLSGNIDIPKQLTDVTTGWVAENAGSGDSSLTFGTVSLTPKTIRSRVDLTRRMLLQSTPAVEQIARNSLAVGLAKAIDSAALNGSGSSNQPTGVLNTSGIGSVTYSETSGATENASVIELETLVAAANADAGLLAYVTTPEVRGRLKGKFVADGAGVPVWNDGLNGYRAEVTNAMPKNLGTGTNEHAIVAGYWPWLYIGEWGVLDLMPDESTLGDSAGLVLRAFQDVDINVAHAAGFSSTTVDVSQA